MTSATQTPEGFEDDPWTSLADVPLDAWFRIKLDQRHGIERFFGIHRITSVVNDSLRFGHDLGQEVDHMFVDWEWTMTPLDESSWRGCYRRYFSDSSEAQFARNLDHLMADPCDYAPTRDDLRKIVSDRSKIHAGDKIRCMKECSSSSRIFRVGEQAIATRVFDGSREINVKDDSPHDWPMDNFERVSES